MTVSGTELAKWRVGHNYSQRELAVELGISVRTMVNWEAEGPMPLPRYVGLALKGLLFTHTEGCRCAKCGGNPLRFTATQKRAYDPYSKKG